MEMFKEWVDAATGQNGMRGDNGRGQWEVGRDRKGTYASYSPLPYLHGQGYKAHKSSTVLGSLEKRLVVVIPWSVRLWR